MLRKLSGKRDREREKERERERERESVKVMVEGKYSITCIHIYIRSSPSHIVLLIKAKKRGKKREKSGEKRQRNTKNILSQIKRVKKV